MAALTAELDLALLKERSSEQYQMAIGNALQDSRRIVNLIDGLLNLAKADYQSEQITMEEVRSGRTVAGRQRAGTKSPSGLSHRISI